MMGKKGLQLSHARTYGNILNGPPVAPVPGLRQLYIPQRAIFLVEPIVSRAIIKIISTTATTLRTLPIIM